MNKRKSITNSNSKSSSKKRLFRNTDEYRHKKPSSSDVPLIDLNNYGDFPVDNSFKIPTESTPNQTPGCKENRTVNLPKLNTKRKRGSIGKSKHLDFSKELGLNDNKATNIILEKLNEQSNGDILADGNVPNFSKEYDYSNKIDESDLLYSETILDSNILQTNHNDDINNAIASQRKKTSVLTKTNSKCDIITNKIPICNSSLKNDIIEEESLLNCLLTNSSIPQIDISTIKESEKCNNVSGSDLLGVTVKDDTIFANLELTQIDHSYKTDSFYGLPMKSKEMFIKNRGISKLYDWQDECLRLKAVHKRQNLVYSLPTSGGKTLVAEILILKELLVREKSAILVLPYVSIVQEKVRGLSPFAVDLQFHIEEYAASKGPIPPKKRRNKKSIYIATIEKANAIVNSLIELERTEEIGMMVVDELHMIGEGGGRGSLLEILLAKVMFKCSDTQIIGMSATLGNMDEIQKFLKAEVYSNNFRPVQLTEFVKVENLLYVLDPKSKCEEELLVLSRKISYPKGLNSSLASRDPDHILSLVLEVIPNNSCLMFCATKKNCESVAMMIAKSLPKELLGTKKAERNGLLQNIRKTTRGICNVLAVTVPYGIAYHHSGLTLDERELIEEAYSSGVLCLLCCTSTLAAGVNLPAKRVILRSPYVGNKFMTRSQYKQMIGRAGRAGIDTSGESILILQIKDKLKSRSLLDGPISTCRSSLLYQEGKGLRQLILSLLGLKICSCESEIESFLQLTLFHIQQSSADEYEEITCIKREIEQLTNLGLVIQNISKDGITILRTSDLGRATLKGCVNIDLAPFVYKQLMKALEALVLVNELHLLYLVTPLDQIGTVQVDWMVFYRQVNKLSELEVKAAEYIGVTQNILSRKATGQRCPKASFDEFIYKRFYLTLVIQEMLKSKTIWEVAETFNTSRGFLQSLFTSTMTFMSLMIHFTEELSELWAFKLLFQALSERITKAKNSEVVTLMEIPGVKQARAMQLFKAGYRTLQHLAWADPKTLCAEIAHLPRRQSELIVCSAKMVLQEKIESLREEADEIAAIPDTPQTEEVVT